MGGVTMTRFSAGQVVTLADGRTARVVAQSGTGRVKVLLWAGVYPRVNPDEIGAVL